MKRDLKYEQKVAQETAIGPSASKRAKLMVTNAQTVEKTNPVKQ
jgi:hypothetical protein